MGWAWDVVRKEGERGGLHLKLGINKPRDFVGSRFRLRHPCTREPCRVCGARVPTPTSALQRPARRRLTSSHVTCAGQQLLVFGPVWRARRMIRHLLIVRVIVLDDLGQRK